ncbi:MAG: ribonuclease Z [Phaeodactylibacter sp.]|nr:ribonuclease Z [Phaeodactylibacter sp.]MCB9287783.1 ribonuclease Z [Lewinellaceae bacterium]
MRFELTLLGTNSALPAYGRFPSAQVLNVQERHYLVDCGEGAQIRMSQFGVRRSKIQQVFISHLHGDHIFGLAGFLSSMALLGREDPIELYSPKGLEEMVRVLFKYSGGLSFPLHFHTLDTEKNQLIFEDKAITVHSLPLVHRVPSAGFLFREKERPRNMRPEKIETYNIHYRDIPAIKAGADYVLPDGRRISNEELTLPPPAPRSYAYCSDTAYHEPLASMIQGVDLLYHESTFCEDMREQAVLTGHSTARQAAEIARLAGAGRLILGHYSSRYKSLKPFLEEARAVFPNTELGDDGRVFEVEA